MNNTLLASAILTAGMMSASSASAQTLRKFEAEVRAFDPASGVTTVSAVPDSGKCWALKLTPQTKLTSDREVLFAEVPLGTPVEITGSLMQKGDRYESLAVFDEDTVVAMEVRVHRGADKSSRVRPGMRGRLLREDGRMFLENDQGRLPVSRGMNDAANPIVWLVGEPATAADIEPGVLGTVVFREHGETPHALESVHLQVRQKPYGSYFDQEALFEEPPVPESVIRESIEKIQANHAAIVDDLDKLAKVDLRVRPMLLQQGETPKLTIRALSEKKPNPLVTVCPNYLRDGTKDGISVSLDWKQDSDANGGTVFTAEAALPTAGVGNYLIHWKCDIGGDIDDYWRNYGVVDNSSTVVLLNICGTVTDSRVMMIENYLPHTYWMIDALHFERLVKPQPAQWWAELSKPDRQYGHEGQLMLRHSSWDPENSRRHGNWNHGDKVYVREVLRAYKETWPLYRYPRECLNAGTYAYGTSWAEVAREEGYESFISICPIHNLEHGGGAERINTTAISHFPHYISTEDFRKTGNETGRNLVAISQWTGNFLRGMHGGQCWVSTEPYWLALEWPNMAGPRGDYRKPYFSRVFNQLSNLAGNDRNNPDHPYFVIGGLEFSHLKPGNTKPWAAPGNRYFTEFWVEKAKAGEPVVFATGDGITAWLLRNHKTSPRHVNYFHDELAGTTQHRIAPLHIPDVIDVEDKDFRAVFGRPGILPEYHYDFNRPWSYPDFGNEEVFRPAKYNNEVGQRLLDRYDITPKVEDWRDLNVTRSDEPGAETHRVTVTVDSPRVAHCVPLAVWDIPRQWQPGTDWLKAENAREFIPVIAPQTDNLNGVLIVDLKEGTNTFTVEITTPVRKLETMDTTFADCVRAKTWTRGTHDGRPVTYLWPQDPWGATVEVTVPEGRSVTAYLTPNTAEQELTAGTHKFDLRFQQWLRLTGPTRQEIASIVNVAEQ